MSTREKRERIIKNCYAKAAANFLLAVKEYQRLNGSDDRVFCAGQLYAIEGIADSLGYSYNFLPDRHKQHFLVYKKGG